jgi:hypothetical protein
MAAPKKVDYERIEPGWRAGILSPAQLAEEYTKSTGTPCSRSAVIKHFTTLGIPRDLKAKIQAKADAMVAQAMVTGKVTAQQTVTIKKTVDTGATVQATVRLAHQATAKRLQTLVSKLATELERQTAKRAALKDRASTAKSLIDAFGRLVAIEREAHGINADTDIDDPLATLLHGLKARTIQPVADDPDHAA